MSPFPDFAILAVVSARSPFSCSSFPELCVLLTSFVESMDSARSARVLRRDRSLLAVLTLALAPVFSLLIVHGGWCSTKSQGYERQVTLAGSSAPHGAIHCEDPSRRTYCIGSGETETETTLACHDNQKCSNPNRGATSGRGSNSAVT